MLVSHQKKFIYLKTAKTASTSVESFFEEFCLPKGSWSFSHKRLPYIGVEGIVGYRGNNQDEWYLKSHASAAFVSEFVGASVWAEYYKFTVIRNPFTKMESAFYFENKLNYALNINTKTLQEDFMNFLKKRGAAYLDRDRYTIDGRLCIDEFIRYEHLEFDVNRLTAHLGIMKSYKEMPLLKQNKGKQIRLGLVYSEPSKKFVEKLFDFEIEYFEYSYPY